MHVPAFVILSASRARKKNHPVRLSAGEKECWRHGRRASQFLLPILIMSNLKRKGAPGDQPPPKSARNSKESRPSKSDSSAAHKPAKTGKQSGKPAESSNTRPQAPVVSLLKDEQPIFPRGGGSVLTPLEQRQIQLEAKADARREDEFETAGSKTQKKVPQQKRKKTTSTKGDKKGNVKKDTEDTVKVDSLSFKV